MAEDIGLSMVVQVVINNELAIKATVRSWWINTSICIRCF